MANWPANAPQKDMSVSSTIILEMNGESYRLGQSKARQAPPKT